MTNMEHNLGLNRMDESKLAQHSIVCCSSKRFKDGKQYHKEKSDLPSECTERFSTSLSVRLD